MEIAKGVSNLTLLTYLMFYFVKSGSNKYCDLNKYSGIEIGRCLNKLSNLRNVNLEFA